MREIKFRAWLQDEEQMVYSNDQSSTDSCEVWIFKDNNLVVQVQETIWREGGGETFERIEYVDCNHVVMQFTGLTDCNGVEIYEGDIAKQRGWENTFVEYCKGKWVLRNDDDKAEWRQDLHDKFYKHIEVIGNKYTTPELLTKK